MSKKLEVRKQGRPSRAKRDMKRNEYHKTMRILESREGNFDMQSKFPAMLKTQFHIIDLRSHDKFGDFALQTKVSWSKNVMEERECPDQILIGADGVLLGLVCCMESRMTSHQQGRFLFGDHDDDIEPDRVNERYCRVLRECWAVPEFIDISLLVRGSLGCSE